MLVNSSKWTAGQRPIPKSRNVTLSKFRFSINRIDFQSVLRAVVVIVTLFRHHLVVACVCFSVRIFASSAVAHSSWYQHHSDLESLLTHGITVVVASTHTLSYCLHLHTTSTLWWHHINREILESLKTLSYITIHGCVSITSSYEIGIFFRLCPRGIIIFTS